MMWVPMTADEGGRISQLVQYTRRIHPDVPSARAVGLQEPSLQQGAGC